MTMRAAAEFFGKVAEDEALAAGITGSSKEDRVKSAIDLGRAHGFDFGTADCEQLYEATRKSQGGELDDELLDAVSGGATGFQLVVGRVWKAISDVWGGNDDPPDDSQIPNTPGGVRG